LTQLVQAVSGVQAGSADTLLYRFELLRLLARKLLLEYRFKWPQKTWWQSDLFNAYLDRIDERSGNNSDRRWMVSQLLRLVAEVPGDTEEVGCY